MAAVVAVVLVVAACESDDRLPGGSRVAPVRQGGHVKFGVLGEPPTLDPYGAVSSDLTHFLARPVYRSLLRVEPDGTIKSDLADLETLRPAGTGVVMTLRDARWSDGTPVTAHDVVRSVDRATEPSGFVGMAAEAVGRDRVRIRGEVFGDWARRLAIATFVTPQGRPLRTAAGPFVVDRYVPGLQLSYVPNPEWDGEAPLLDRITVTFVASLEIMLQLLEDGRLDAAAVPSAVNIDERLAEYGLHHASTLGREVIALDLGQMSNRHLRTALVAGVQSDAIAEGLIRDEGELIPARGVPDAEGFPPGTEIRLGTAAGDELLGMIQRVLQRQFEDDIQSELVTIDPATFYGEWESSSPLDVALRREIAPGFVSPRLTRDLTRYPLFRVESFLAWDEGVVGLVPNGGLDGPLWNAEKWALE